ncbi:MAG: hypothetical protein LKF47_00825 [Megasphaera sp.]|nr:hypothetical protein [Megasphaera sp.]MCI1248248.1 hypothetical protein [Megasphaera sp.]
MKLEQVDFDRVKKYADKREVGGLTVSDDQIKNACEIVEKLAQPKGVLIQCSYEEESHSVLCDTPFVLKGKEIHDYIVSSNIIFMSAVTISKQIEDKIDELFLAQDFENGLALDCAAAIGTLQVADDLVDQVNEISNPKGYHVSWRLCPGAGDWPEGQQLAIAAALHADKIGINFTASGLIEPRKTIVSMMGLQYIPDSCNSSGGCAGCSMSNFCTSHQN